MKVVSISIKSAIIFLLVGLIESAAIIYFLNEGLDFNDQNIVLALIIGALIGMILNLALFEFMVIKRLKRITNEITKLIEGRNYNRIESSANDEIGITARFFNEITRQIERIANDLRNAERLSGEIGLAAKIQSDVLPKKAPIIPGVEMIAKTRSAAEMGGDSFDFIQQEGQTMFYIGDVTGHGVAAGLVMMMVNILIRAFAPLYNRTDQILIKVNEILYTRIAANMFMTLTKLRWHHNDQKLFYTGCGHEYILHYKSSEGKCKALKSGGIALGMTPDISKISKEVEIDFKENDLIVLYTDGITEARNQSGEMFEIERLQKLVEKYGNRNSAESVFDNITEDFGNFVGKYENQVDDITLIVLKNRGTNYKQESVKLVINNPEKIAGEKWTW